MTPVSFPYIEPTFKTAMQEVLGPFFDTGDTLAIGGMNVDFYKCELHYNLDLVRTESTQPRIGILGNRSNNLKDEKCIDPLGNMPIGYVRRLEAFRSIYISAPRSLQIQVPPYSSSGTRLINWEDMDRIYSQLHAIMSTQIANLTTRNIFRPAITPTPVIAPDKEYFILYGVLNCELRFSFARS